jgi:hypothetical protein
VLLLDFFDLRPGLETPLEIPGILGRLIVPQAFDAVIGNPPYISYRHITNQDTILNAYSPALAAQGGWAMIMMLAVDNSELLDPRNLIQRSPEWRAERCGKATIERDRVLRTFVRDRLSRKGGKEQDWKSYGLAMLTFSLAGFVALYALQRLQAVLPFNPQHLDAVSPDLAFNTSVSFVTNTPETTMSYLTQLAGLTVHNFVSAATGIALAIALIRGFARRTARTIGNSRRQASSHLGKARHPSHRLLDDPRWGIQQRADLHTPLGVACRSRDEVDRIPE